MKIILITIVLSNTIQFQTSQPIK